MSEPADTPASPPSAPEEPPVEIHRPIPIRSWREFLAELRNIALGVLIAPSAEQAVSWLYSHERVMERCRT
jgi:hypothetical protein